MKRVGVVLAPLGAVAGVLTLRHLGRTFGSTPEERNLTLPGDDLVENARTVATHATTIAAAPEEVWPWLVQMGWDRAAGYTGRWVDVLLLPQNLPSADLPGAELQHLGVGNVIPDGAPEALDGLVVVEEETGRHLVLRSNSHLPLARRQSGTARAEWTWSFVLIPETGGTRLVFRWRARTWPGWLTIGMHDLVLPADFMMSRDMLRGIAARATSASDTRNDSDAAEDARPSAVECDGAIDRHPGAEHVAAEHGS